MYALTHDRRRWRRVLAAPWCGALAAILTHSVLVPGGLHGSPRTGADTLRLAQAVALAREANPMLRAARFQVTAARERERPAAAWTDPELRIGLMNRSLSGGAMADPMGMTSIQLTQMIPWNGRPGHQGRAARALAESEHQALREQEAQVAAAVTTAFVRLATIDREHAVQRETLDLLRGLREVAMARYAAGEAPQQDVLRAQVAVARMEGDLLMLEGARRGGAARLNGLLGRAGGATVVAVLEDAPLVALAPLDSLVARAVDARPAVVAGEGRVVAAEHALAAARAERWPELMVGVEYARRADFDDMASFMVGARLPVFAGSRQRPMEREREAMRAMAVAEVAALELETQAMLAERWAMAERARRLAAVYDEDVLPQAEATVTAARSAYRVGAADFDALIDSQMTLNRFRVERLQLVAEYLAARADIAALLGSVEEG